MNVVFSYNPISFSMPHPQPVLSPVLYHFWYLNPKGWERIGKNCLKIDSYLGAYWILTAYWDKPIPNGFISPLGWFLILSYVNVCYPALLVWRTTAHFLNRLPLSLQVKLTGLVVTEDFLQQINLQQLLNASCRCKKKIAKKSKVYCNCG